MKRYDGERIEVTYDAARCLHAAECVRGLPEGGPALLEGDLELEGNRETRAALCRCGKSANQPYCDHSGPCQQWEFQRGERSA